MSDYESLREDLSAAVSAMSNYAAAVNRREDATTVELQRLWNDFAELRDEVLAVANRLEALTNFVVSNPAEVAAKIVTDANRATAAEMTSPAPVLAMLPTYPEVRCDECRNVYKVNDDGGLITGNCPKCGHGRFSTTFAGTAGVSEVVEWQLGGDNG